MNANFDEKWGEIDEDYRTFLLRCWQEVDVENGDEPLKKPSWRFSLVQLNDQATKQGFACLSDLVDYLQSRFGRPDEFAKNLSGNVSLGPANAPDEIA